jgi:DNA-directed RNA polymerase specialized sigma24 family protein
MQPNARSSPAGAPREGSVEEPQSFETFFEEHRSKLFGAMCLVTGNRQEAEEITQDALLNLWERWGRISRLEDPTGFLFRTAMNVFRNRARRATLAARKALGLAVVDVATGEGTKVGYGRMAIWIDDRTLLVEVRAR